MAIKNLIQKLRNDPKSNFIIIRCLEQKLDKVDRDSNIFIKDYLLQNNRQ